MKKMNESELLEFLETQIVDKYKMSNILNMLATICYQKSEHIATNWQDKPLAESWEKVGNKIDSIISKVMIYE